MPEGAVKRVADMRPYTLGALQGNGWVRQNLRDHNVYFANSVDALIGLLLSGRVEIIPENPFVMRYHLIKRGAGARVNELTELYMDRASCSKARPPP